MAMRKYFIFGFLLSVVSLAACSTNPATGERQFTALLPASQEASIGAQEHEKVKQTFGDFAGGPIGSYVSQIGNRLVANTERSDVQYKFFVIDSPMVNAFAIPGGYVYVTRGLLALANSEAELAAVMAHEIGHITARHSAERASQGFLASLGGAILSTVVDTPGVSDVANLGSNLFLTSYSRGQEHQADELGVRYLSRAGYSPQGMALFLQSLEAHSALEQRLSGGQTPQFSFFSTHPQTGDRVARAYEEARQYVGGANATRRDDYLNAINGLVYGDSAAQGFARGQDFYHPGIGFTFSVPAGFDLKNAPTQVSAKHSSGAVVLFDSVKVEEAQDPLSFMTQVWMRGEQLQGAEAITINGMRAATGAFNGMVNGRNMSIRVVAIEWAPGQFFRFQMAIPSNVSAALVEDLKRTTYSFRRMSAAEKRSITPRRITLVRAGAGDTPASLSARMAVDEIKEQQFRVLNGLQAGQSLAAGQVYKVVQ